MQTAALIIALLVMLAGLVGVLMPAIPGIPLIWLAILGYGFVDRFRAIGPTFLVVTLALVVLSQMAEYYAKAWGAKKYGAGRAGMWGAVIGSIIGLFFMPIGLLAGPFLGALVAELLAGRSANEALRAGWGGLVGVLGSVAVNFVLALTLIIAFVIQVL
jgi:uncharacterized protein